MNVHFLQVCALLGLVLSSLTSCESSSGDVMNPTISQMDKMDTQWGLPARQTRGVPRRSTSVGLSAATIDGQASPGGGFVAPVQSVPPVNEPAPAAAPAPVGVDPTVIQKLR